MASSPTNLSLRNQYILLLPIGQGTFGCVRLAFHRLTGTPVAVKILEHSEKNLRWILSEMAVLETINHPHIVRLFQTMITPYYFYLITEYIPGGNLMQKILQASRLEEKEAKKIFGQIIGAIKYCHNLGIVHRDLKPQNILIDEDGNAKVIDFGLAVKCKAGTRLHRHCGTQTYNAPELFLEEGYDGTKADIWSLGVILYVMTTGHLPFVGNTVEELQGKIIRGEYEVPGHVSGQLENLIHQILTVIPERRPTIEDIENHPWVIKCEEYSENIMKPETCPDPTILGVLKDLGYDTKKVCESLEKRLFDDHMAIYLLLQEQARQGLGLGYTIPEKPVDPGPMPPPSLENLSSSPIPMRRTASDLDYHLSTSTVFNKNVPTDVTPSGQKVVRCASQPLAAFCCPSKDMNTYDYAPPCDAEDATPSENRSLWQRVRDGIRVCVQRCC